MNAYYVVVVGGRVAGASTALLLARAGARVAVVDRGSLDRDTVSTHALMRAGVLQLGRWGVLDRIVAAGTPPVRHTVFGYPDGERVRVSIRGSHGVEALYAHDCDALYERVRESGADVLQEPTDQPYGVRDCAFRDPAGNQLRFLQRPAE